jgi:hypothetical protein
MTNKAKTVVKYAAKNFAESVMVEKLELTRKMGKPPAKKPTPGKRGTE